MWQCFARPLRRSLREQATWHRQATAQGTLKYPTFWFEEKIKWGLYARWILQLASAPGCKEQGKVDGQVLDESTVSSEAFVFELPTLTDGHRWKIEADRVIIKQKSHKCIHIRPQNLSFCLGQSWTKPESTTRRHWATIWISCSQSVLHLWISCFVVLFNEISLTFLSHFL